MRVIPSLFLTAITVVLVSACGGSSAPEVTTPAAPTTPTTQVVTVDPTDKYLGGEYFMPCTISADPGNPNAELKVTYAKKDSTTLVGTWQIGIHAGANCTGAVTRITATETVSFDGVKVITTNQDPLTVDKVTVKFYGADGFRDAEVYKDIMYLESTMLYTGGEITGPDGYPVDLNGQSLWAAF